MCFPLSHFTRIYCSRSIQFTAHNDLSFAIYGIHYFSISRNNFLRTIWQIGVLNLFGVPLRLASALTMLFLEKLPGYQVRQRTGGKYERPDCISLLGFEAEKKKKRYGTGSPPLSSKLFDTYRSHARCRIVAGKEKHFSWKKKTELTVRPIWRIGSGTRGMDEGAIDRKADWP